MQPQTFSLEAPKAGFIISILQGKLQTWAHQLLEENHAQIHTMSSFFDAVAQLYDDPQRTVTAEAAIHALQQGRRVGVDYITDFRR